MKGLASFGVLASTLVAVRLLLTEDSVVAAWSCAVGVLAATGVLAGARVHRLPEVVVWRLLATGALLLPVWPSSRTSSQVPVGRSPRPPRSAPPE